MKNETKNNSQLKKGDGLSLPKSWEIKKLGEVCEIELGKTPYRKDKSYWDTEKQTNNVWLSISDLLNTEDKFVYDSKEYISDKGKEISKIVKKGTLLLSFKLTIGRLAFAGKDLYTNEAIAALTIKKGELVDNFFLYNYLLFFDWDKATKGESKVKGRTLNKSKLKELEVIIPPLPEQKHIVSILDRAFEAIDKAKANAEQNLKNAKELFESYLNRIFEEKGEDWEIKNFEKCIEKVSCTNKIKKKNFLLMGKYPIVSQEQDLINGYWDNSADLFEIKKPVVIFGDHTKVVKYIDFDFVLGADGVKIFQPKSEIEPRYFYYFLQNVDLGDLGYARHYRLLKEIEIHYPKSLETQKQIVAQLDKLQAETKKLEAIYQQKINNLEELKKSILQKAFNGEL